MGKHNGKARNSGMKVGSALLSKKAHDKQQEWAAYRHTTDVTAAGPTMQSVIEQNDLSELMNMADLAGRDFAGERGAAVVISTNAAAAQDTERSRAERAAAQERHADALCIPRRPPWTRKMSADKVQAQEQQLFLNWRRRLAKLEEEEGLVMTPFEKNLEVWRQLWRVLERSDFIVQVVDARDPLFYRSEDLERYARELSASKGSLLLLNKADLLPEAVRTLWADYFDAAGVRYAFWSAAACIARQRPTAADEPPPAVPPQPADARIRLLDEPQLIELFTALAAEARAAALASAPAAARSASEGSAAEAGSAAADASGDAAATEASEGDRAATEAPAAATEASGSGRPPTVGLVGFPNVGKSSTINALFGSKKTAVAATPGKTKHFQTLHISEGLVLCDCPGLVLPRFASSRAEMVAAGVVPIDRLTDMHAPVAAIAARVSRHQLYAKLGVTTTAPADHEPPNRPPTAPELLRALAVARGWLNGSGLPDETRTGRQLLKDYTAGRLVFCEWPPGAPRPCALDDGLGTFTRRPDLLQFASRAGISRTVAKGQGEGKQSRAAAKAVSGLTAKDVADMKAMRVGAHESEKAGRAEHKFQKKPQKHSKVNARVCAKAGVSPYGGFGEDGAGLETFVQVGKKGGVVR